MPFQCGCLHVCIEGMDEVKVFLQWVANPVLEAAFQGGYPIANDLDCALLDLIKLTEHGIVVTIP